MHLSASVMASNIACIAVALSIWWVILFEEVHELKLELVGFKRVKPRVSLKKIKDYMRENYVPQTSEEFAKILTELNIEVSDE